jgi:RimJ/RimL family protein N-acetyltransferase
MTDVPFRPLRTRRLDVVAFGDACLDDEYLGWLNDPVTMRFSNQRFRRHTRESAQAYLRSFAGTPSLFVSLRLAGNGRMIGTMTAHVAAPHATADMGLLIGARDCWGQGYGLEAWSALMHHLFDERKLRKITGGTVRANIGMRLIMERSGMQLEGIRARQEIIEGTEEDVLYYARFRDL